MAVEAPKVGTTLAAEPADKGQPWSALQPANNSPEAVKVLSDAQDGNEAAILIALYSEGGIWVDDTRLG